MFLSMLASALMFAALAANADTVYRCIQGGRTVFSDTPVADSCAPLDLKVQQPNPEEVARAEEQKRRAAERNREEREQAAMDRLLQAQTEAARAAARQAEAQRRLAEQQALATQRPLTAEPYAIWPGYGYPYQRPFPVPTPPLYPPQVPVRPPTGNYPYGVDRSTVGAARR
jgi:hypothetical protein